MKSMQLPMLKYKGTHVKKTISFLDVFQHIIKDFFIYLWQQLSQIMMIKQQLPRINQLLVLFRL